jgi:WD40 repeat protein
VLVGDRQVRSAAFSPDGRRIFLGGQDGVVRVLDEQAALLGRSAALDGPVTRVVAGDHGVIVAIYGEPFQGETLVILEAASLAVRSRPLGAPRARLALSDDGALVSYPEAERWRVVRTADGTMVTDIPALTVRADQPPLPASSVTFSRDGAWVAAARDIPISAVARGRFTSVFRVADGVLLFSYSGTRTVGGPPVAVGSPRFSWDGRVFWDEGTFRRLPSGEPDKTWTSALPPHERLEFTPAHRVVVQEHDGIFLREGAGPAAPVLLDGGALGPPPPLWRVKGRFNLLEVSRDEAAVLVRDEDSGAVLLLRPRGQGD